MKIIRYLLVAALGAISGVNAQDNPARTVPSYEPYARIEWTASMAWSPDDRQIVYPNGNPAGATFYIVSSSGGTPRPFFTSPTTEVVGGPDWSPDGSRLAFRLNRNGGARIWTSDSSGGDLRQVTPYPVNGPARVVWSADGKQLALVWGAGDRIMIVPPSGGDPKPFANGTAPALSPDGKRVAYFSLASERPEADTRIWIKAVEGSESKRLDSLSYRPELGAGGLSLDCSPDGKRLLTVKPVNGSWQLAVVNVDEDKAELTLPVNGSARNPRWSHDGKRIAYDCEDTGHPARLEVLTLEGRQTIQLSQTPVYTTAQLVRYRTGNGVEIPSWLYLPRNADRAKHPALIWLHGSPDTAMNTFLRRIQYLVDQGFVVLVVNYGPSSGLGDEERRIDRLDDFMPDIFASVDYLKALKSVDSSRIGIGGHSFGGYAALRSIIARPDLFPAAVDESGSSDLLKFYKETSERARAAADRVMGGPPEQNPEAYRAASPIHFAERIKTPVLILHGTADQMVPYHHSADMAEALEREKKQYEFITYKNAGHVFAGKDEIDANQQIARFLLAHLTGTKGQ